MNKFKTYVEKHPDVFSILLLAGLCGIFLFWGLNFYPLIDVDETRYAIMSKDLMNSNKLYKEIIEISKNKIIEDEEF